MREMIRITKQGFLISKPNTDYKGLDSRWYGKSQFFYKGELFDGSPRWEHINFIPNYELEEMAKYYGLNFQMLSDEKDSIQFFLFMKKQSFNILTGEVL